MSATATDAQSSEPGVSREPMPDELAAFAETIELLLNGFDDRDQQIVLLRLQSCTEQEISERVALSERTVRRVLTRTKARLRSLIETED